MYSLDEETNDEEELEKEAQDYSRPFSPPDGQIDRIPEDHPDLDTDTDAQEWYDAGRSAAAGANDTGPGSVVGYNPPASASDDDDEDDSDSAKKSL